MDWDLLLICYLPAAALCYITLSYALLPPQKAVIYFSSGPSATKTLNSCPIKIIVIRSFLHKIIGLANSPSLADNTGVLFATRFWVKNTGPHPMRFICLNRDRVIIGTLTSTDHPTHVISLVPKTCYVLEVNKATSLPLVIGHQAHITPDPT